MTNTLKVCIITSWFPSKLFPSIAPFVYKFAMDLIDFGMDVSVITTLGPGDIPFVELNKLKIYRVNQKFSIISIFNIINDIGPNFLHVQAPNYFSSISLIVGRIKKIPVLATVHRAEIDSTNRFVSLLRRIVLSKYCHIVAVSNHSKSLAIRAGARKHAISVVYNSSDENIFKSVEQTLARNICNLPLDKKIILFVGNLIKLKGIYILIESLKYLVKKIDFKAIIIGTGEEEENLKRLVIISNLSDKVSFIGWMPQDKLPYFYNAADVFVLPSFKEGNSVAILESMACGTPIIASTAGGNPESIQDGLNGFLISIGDSQDLCHKIETILKDDNVYNSFSKKCIEVYNTKFSKNKQINEYLKIYRKMLRNRNE
jgi:glycosyltransferase involved in cell wall biosynthesis